MTIPKGEPSSSRSVRTGTEARATAPLPCASAPAALIVTSNSPGRAGAIGIAAFLFTVAIWVFLPALRNDFIDCDYALFVTANPQVQRGLTWASVGWAFRHPVAANWHPLTTLSHMLDFQLYGLKPWGHHLTNVLLHAASTVLLFVVFRRMTGACWRSAVLAALFAFHPLRVESVAWISERKDVLSGLFWLLTMLAYVRYTQESKVQSPKSKVAYLLALVLFACGLMSKPMLVTLPLVLLLLDYWPLRRTAERGMRNAEPEAGSTVPGRWMRLAWEKAPFLALAAVASTITFAVQAGAGAVATTGRFPLAVRAQNTLVAYGRYLGKTFWPTDLSAFYPYPTRWPAVVVLLCGGLVAGLSVTALAVGLKRRYLLTGWLWFVGTLVPVIGLVQIGRQSLADRYTYIPSIGLLLVLVWGAHELTARWRCRAVILSVVAVLAALLCTALTRRQIGYWKDDETVWLHALAVTENNDLANYNLGVTYFNQGVTLTAQGAFDEAMRYYVRAIQLSPEKADAHSSLAYALLKKGRLADAIHEYEESLRLNPIDAEAHNNLGHILARQGRPEEAIPHFTEALRLNADYPEAHDNLGAALASRGRYGEAAAQFREVLRLKPDDPLARQKLERAVAAQQQLNQSFEGK